MKFLSRVLSRAALLLAGILVALCLIEALMSVVHLESVEQVVYAKKRPVVHAIWGRHHLVLGYTLRPGLHEVRISYAPDPVQLDYRVSTNSDGFRGAEWDRTPGRRNVVVLGDSFAFGWGCAWEDTLGRRLERALQAVDSRFQVVLLAQAGWNLEQVIQAQEILGRQFDPEAVVYAFCHNDILSLPPDDGRGGYRLGAAVMNESDFAALIERNQPDVWSWDKAFHTSRLTALHSLTIRPLFSSRKRESMRRAPVPPGLDWPSPLPVPPPSADLTPGPGHRYLLWGLARLQAAAPRSRLVLLEVGDKNRLRKEDSVQSDRWQLRDYAQGHAGVGFIDFESLVRSTPGSAAWFLDYDEHWSARGHEEAARLILDRILRPGGGI